MADSSLIDGGCIMVGGYAEGIYGGCESAYGVGGMIAVAVLILAILLLYYLWPREKVCGGKDQGCCCDGNEMMAGGNINGRQPVGKVTDAEWTKVLMGH